MIRFSRRLDWTGTANALATLEASRRAAGDELLDLTVGNPTAVGLDYPVAELAAALADAASQDGARYRPEPFGMPDARAAVAADYARRGADVTPDRIALTASSSESYAHLFKLLCDPGDVVLVPEPGYPLFEYLARLEGVEPRPYRLAFDGRRWRIDFSTIEIGGARALCLVNPNNPTGSFLAAEDCARIQALAAAHDAALVVDEVFADYGLDVPADAVTCAAAGPREALTFCLGGLSKAAGLPQLKLGWIAAGGPAPLVDAALARFELVADSYLSAGTPVQRALPRLLTLGARIREQIIVRVRGNLRQLAAALGAGSPCTVLPIEGGWSAIVRVPAKGGLDDERWALRLLAEDGVLVQPGYFFDLDHGQTLVLSLLVAPDVFARGVARIAARAAV